MSGVPLVRVSDFTARSISMKECLRVNETHSKLWNAHRLREGEILVATVGSWPPNWASVVGKAIRVPKEAAGAIQNQNTCSIVAEPGLADQRFLFYQLKTLEFALYAANSAGGSANQARLPVANLALNPFRLPSLPEQTAIADVLGVLDDRVALAERQNTALEAIARAIFKSWFVDFYPVRAKAEGREPEGMDASTASLFPSEFSDTELGQIPAGWTIKTLAEIATFQNGFAFKSSDWVDSGFPVVKVGNVKPGIVELDDCSFVSKDVVSNLSRFRLSDGDLLVGMTGYVGETGLIPILDEHCYLNQRVGRLSVGSGLCDLGFVYCLVRGPEFKSFAEAQAHGSAQANVSGASLMAYKLVSPADAIADCFNAILSPVLSSILSRYRQGKILGEIRDVLLPRLISGKLRVSEAEKMVEAVL